MDEEHISSARGLLHRVGMSLDSVLQKGGSKQGSILRAPQRRAGQRRSTSPGQDGSSVISPRSSSTIVATPTPSEPPAPATPAPITTTTPSVPLLSQSQRSLSLTAPRGEPIVKGSFGPAHGFGYSTVK